MGFGSPPLHSLWFCDLLWTNKYSRRKWCHFQTYTSRILFFLLMHWAPCLYHMNKPQANNKKDKVEDRWIIPDESQICETAQQRPAKLTHNWPQTQEQAQWTLKELTSGAQLKVLTHGQDTKKWCLFQPLTSGMIYYSAIANCYK